MLTKTPKPTAAAAAAPSSKVTSSTGGPNAASGDKNAQNPPSTQSNAPVTSNAPATDGIVNVMDENSVLFGVKVLQVRNIRGSKGEHINSFVKIQFAEYETKDVSFGNLK